MRRDGIDRRLERLALLSNYVRLPVRRAAVQRRLLLGVRIRRLLKLSGRIFRGIHGAAGLHELHRGNIPSERRPVVVHIMHGG